MSLSRAVRPQGFILITLLVIFMALGLYGWYWYAKLTASLPSVQSLRNPDLGAPLRIFTADGRLIGEFGAEKRTPMSYEQFPPQLIKAFLAAEDDQFFNHKGVDYMGLMRAALKLATGSGRKQGGSTITMQLARNVFLTPEKSYERKIREILLARKMEAELSKEQILEIYLNRIFLGNRAYGVAAAAYVYFGKSLSGLTLSEHAILAALPKAPSQLNPISNPKRAQERRDYVLRRMLELNYINRSTHDEAVAELIVAREHATPVELEAAYVAEMVRAEMVNKYGEDAYRAGYRVTTTVQSERQLTANGALRAALLDYEQRHGFDGAEAVAEGEALAALGQANMADNPELIRFLRSRPAIVQLPAAVVLGRSGDGLAVFSLERGQELITTKGLAWAGRAINRVGTGSVVRLRLDGEFVRIAHIPKAQAAMVALNPQDGAIISLVGGFDFYAGKFNRVTQAKRQVGSGFKPFVYAAAVAKAYTPASVFLDAPFVSDPGYGQKIWRPSNYDGTFKGPMRMREALVQSRNLVSIRVLESTGLRYVLDYAQRFGFAPETLPANLTLSLGTASLTPLEVTRGYAVFANGGFLVDPYFIRRIEDAQGNIVMEAKPVRACPECPAEITAGDTAAQLAPRVMDPQTRYMMTSMLHDVTVRGTAASLRQLGRKDLAGKTGTTNDETDAWFNGYNFAGDVVASAWVGYDQPRPLGNKETGGKSALPIWSDYMRTALNGVPEIELTPPDGMVALKIRRGGGSLNEAGEHVYSYLSEWVPADRIPARQETPEEDTENEAGEEAEELF
jgi:penicillin-binding protein 1A